MDLILEFVTAHMRFLWRDGKFRISGSTVSPANGGSAELFLESAAVAMNISCDRRILLLQIGPRRGPGTSGTPKMYSVDLIKKVILGEWNLNEPFSPRDARFVEVNLENIESMFSPSSVDQTELTMKTLKKERGRLMFG
ncbi:hypothetical protein [Williamsia sp. M5A3_1d]